MRLPPFDYHSPNTLDKALKIKAELGASAPVLAGGTDLIVNLRNRLLSPAAVIGLRNIGDMRGIEVHPDAVVLRAGTSLADTANHDAVKDHFPILARAVQSIGAVGIQHFRGTIGGNLCLTPRCLLYNQSLFWRTGKGACHRTGGKDCLVLKGSESCQAICSADTAPVLVSLAAQLTIAGLGGTRTIPISDFFTGKGESPFNLRPDEILTGIRLPIPWHPISSSYQRLAMRSAVDFPLINAAAVAIMSNGKIESFRMTLSAAGPAPVALKDVETTVRGLKPDQDMVRLVREAAIRVAEGSVVENASASREYRVQMAGVVASRALKEALNLNDEAISARRYA
jgi:4-hydroxybenzoyl-CoA reductase subunit beta